MGPYHVHLFDSNKSNKIKIVNKIMDVHSIEFELRAKSVRKRKDEAQRLRHPFLSRFAVLRGSDCRWKKCNTIPFCTDGIVRRRASDNSSIDPFEGYNRLTLPTY